MEMMFSRWAPEPGAGRLLYDVGSFDVNGSYRHFCEGKGWGYRGIDIVDTSEWSLKYNVDTCVTEKGSWNLEEAELVISGQCLEHTKFPWEWIKQVKSIMRETTFLFLIAPASWPEHKHPIDCWRILPDGMKALAEWADLDYIEGGLHPTGKILSQDCFDCWAVMRKK